MPLYEHIFLARQDVSAQQVESLTKDFQAVIGELGGSIAKTEYWGVKTLSYKIKKNRKAHFTLMNIDAPHAAVAEMERRMQISTDVLRFLTLRVSKHESEPSAMMRKSDRDDRRGGRRFGGGGGGGRRDDGRHRGGPRHEGGPRRDAGPRHQAGAGGDRSNARPVSEETK